MKAASPAKVSNATAKAAKKNVPEERYVSKYIEKIKEEYERGKSAHKTLGVPSYVFDLDGNFIKGRSKSVPKKSAAGRERRPIREREASQPARALEWKKAEKSRVDFAKGYVRDVQNFRTLKGRKYVVDDRHGNVQSLILSGMYPYYRNRKDYGRLPDYILEMTGKHGKSVKRVSVERGSPGRGTSPRRGREREKHRTKEKRMVEVSRVRGTSPRRDVTTFKDNKRREGKKKVQTTRTDDKSKKQQIPEARESKAKEGAKKDASATKEERAKQMQKTKSPERAGGGGGGGRRREGGGGGRGGRKEESRDKKKLKDSTEKGKAKSQPKEKLKGIERKTLKKPETEVSSTVRDDSKIEESVDGDKPEAEGEGQEKEAQEEEEEEKRGEAETETETETELESTYSKRERDESSDDLEYRRPKCRYVTEDERAELIYGMKMKWDETMKKFQCLPFLTDTPQKKRTKSKMEKYLAQLEKDIETIERHPYIYVYSDPED